MKMVPNYILPKGMVKTKPATSASSTDETVSKSGKTNKVYDEIRQRNAQRKVAEMKTDVTAAPEPVPLPSSSGLTSKYEDLRKRNAERAKRKPTTGEEPGSELRDASLLDLTWNSARRGYFNAAYGQESYKEMIGSENEKEKYEKILSEDDYQFETNNDVESAVSGVFELLGQQAKQLLDWRPVAVGVGGAIMTTIAGQAGPQIATPEEIITVPAGFFAGYDMGVTIPAFEIEAGLAYDEMTKMGISEETARDVALAVGGVNAGLEFVQLEELTKAFKIVNKGGKETIAKILAKVLFDTSVDVAKESAQEVAQEGVTIAGTQIASKKEKGEWAYTTEEVLDRLGDTLKSSVLSFGLMNAPAAGGKIISGVNSHTVDTAMSANPNLQSKTEEGNIKKIQQTVLTSAQKANVSEEVSKAVSAAAVQLKQPMIFASQDSRLVELNWLGAYIPSIDTVALNPNVSQENMLGYVMAHEMAHSAANTEQMALLEKTVQRMVGQMEWQAQLEKTKADYAAFGIKLDDHQVRTETLANWVGHNLFKDGFAQAVVKGNAKTGNFFLQTIDKVRRALIGQKNNPSAGDIAMLERLFMQAVENKPGVRSGDVEYSIRLTSQMNYQEQLRLIENREINGVHSLFVGRVHSLESAGIEAAPFVMNQSDYRKSRRTAGNNKHYSAHSVPFEFFEKLQENMQNAPMLIDNGKKVTIVTEVAMSDTKGANSFVIAGVLRNETMEGDTVHLVKSVYPLDDFATRIKTAAETGTLVVINENKAKQMLATIGVQPSELSNIVDLATSRLSQYADGVNTQSMYGEEIYAPGSLLPGETFTGNPPANAEAVTDGQVSQPDAGTVDAPANEAQVLERAVETTRQGRRKVDVAETTDADESVAEIESVINQLGEQMALWRLYNAAQVECPTGRVTIDGQTVDADAYMNAYDQSLPDNLQELGQIVHDLERQQAEEAVRVYREGEAEKASSNRMKLNLQMFAAKRKWDLLQLDPGENGKKARKFYENRLKGKDVLHNNELAKMLAGHEETYNPICNQKTLDEANRNLLDPKYNAKLQKRIGRMNANDRFSRVDIAATMVLIKNAYNEGDYGAVVDLVAGLSRKGTEAGRAVQAFSMMARLTPEGTLKAAVRTMRKEADAIIGEGANQGLDTLSKNISDALNKLARLKGTGGGSYTGNETTGVVTDAESQMGGETRPMTRSELKEALADDLAATEGTYLTRETIEENLERVIRDATDVPEQVKRYVLKRIRKKDGGLVQRLYEVHQKGHLTADATRRALEEALELPTLTESDVKTLMDMTTKALELQSDPVAQADAMDEIYDFLGAKLPVSKMEMLQAWRKFAMLANVKTHMRNFFSNAVNYYAISKETDLLATGMEFLLKVDAEKRGAYFGWSFTKHGKSIQETLAKHAETAVLEMQKRSPKYEVAGNPLKTHRKMFGKSKLGELFNSLSDFNSEWLEREDTFFFRRAYVDALGQMMTARKVTEVTNEMHQKAMERALEVTFRADNALSDFVGGLKKNQSSSKKALKLAGHVADVVIPFNKTPANIAKQSVMLTPLGAAKGAFDFYNAVWGKGTKEASDAINKMAKGLTGTSLFVIGILLGKAGLFNTGYGKTEKERAADELEGKQENAVQICGTWITLDWLQPVAAPLIVGASMATRIEEEGLSLSSVFGAVMDGTDALFELSMLQSLYDVLGGYDAGASASAFSVMENVVSQSVPTLVGQAARAIDPVQRKTTGDSDFETIVNQVVAKIPGLTYLLDPELDVWGNEVYRTGKPTAGNAAVNAAQQFLLPFNYKQGVGSGDAVSQEILRLYEGFGSSVIPTAITRDKARDEGLDYVDANRLLGSMNRAAVVDFINDVWAYQVQVTMPDGSKKMVTKYYSEMTDDERRRVLERIYRNTKDLVTGDTEEKSPDKKTDQDRYFEKLYEEMS